MSKPAPPQLAKINAHPRDAFITFDEGPHIYTVHGKQGYTSVTTWNHHHFEEFDADSIISNMLRGRRMSDPTYKYYGMTREQIKADWDRNRDEAAAAGTKMHYDIECFYNGLTVSNSSTEYEWFQRFVRDFPELKPYRTEWCVYYEELKLSGSIDMIFENPDGTLQIYDWKRCKEIKKKPFGSEDYSNNSLISHIPDTNYWHYCLQLNTYKAILERCYDKRVTDMKLVCLHPDNGSYQCIQVVNLQKEVTALFEERINSLTALFEERTISLT